MFPGFGYKQPYPQAMPPQMKAKASNPPFTYENWPHHCGYPVPTQCHSCYNYYPYMPHPYTHLPTPPPLHPQYYYPVYPEPHPFHYAPPHHYTMELPKYEYDKTIPHCHGCYHHSKDQGVKIEEHEPQARSREEAFNKPVVWVPSDYPKSQERPSDSTKVRGEGERDSKLSGWMPLDMENLIRLLQNGKLRKDEDDQPKDQVHQMPFPVFWLPYNNEEKGKKSIQAVGAEDNKGEKLSVEKRDKPPRTIAVKQEDDPPKNQVHQMPFPMVFLPCNNEGKGQKSIPADKTGEKVSVEKRDKPLRTIHVQPLDEIDGTQAGDGLKAKNKEDEKKSAKEDAKSKPSSPTKASKLPPICLRIDPLPKKKNGEGKSRSPSPPRDKAQQVEVVKPSSSSSSSSSPSSVAEQDAVEAKQEAQEVKEKKSEKKMLSGEEAATVIQSVYRGYEVRRWEPLKKMRQIVKIQEEAAALKKCIEASVDSMDLKQKTSLGENIMSLLLKLDTIQGLHSSVRDIRKLVARELVSLQEMLDTIVIKQPEETITLKDDSSQSPGISEGGSKAPQTLDETCMSSSLSRNEVHSEVEIEENTEDKSYSLHEPSTQGESCTAEDLESCEITDEQATEPKVGEEVGRGLSDSASGENEIDEVGDSAIKNEDYVDSADQIDMVLDLPASKEVSEDAEIESEKLHDSDEASKEIEFVSSEKVQEESDYNITEPVNAEAAEGVEEEEICSTENNKAKEDETQVQEEFDCSVTEPVKVETPLNDEAEDAEEVKMASSENNKAKEDESQVKIETQVNDEAEEVKLAIPSTENRGDKEDESKRRAMEDMEKMRDLLEKMIESGKEQQQVVYNLNQKIKELEGKIAKQKEMNKKKKKKARVSLRRGPRKSPMAKQF